MTLRTAGGLAALTCAATYLVGFALLLTILVPLGFGSSEIDAVAVVAFAAENPGLLIAWNTTIYVVNALALAVLVVALHATAGRHPGGLAEVARLIGTVWVALVLGAGMIANVAVERAHALAADPDVAAALWQTLHAVELGLGGGNEIAGGAWILLASGAGRASRAMGRATALIGGVTGAAGLATILPPLGDVAGAVFGLGAILWFLAVAATMLRPSATPIRADADPAES